MNLETLDYKLTEFYDLENQEMEPNLKILVVKPDSSGNTDQQQLLPKTLQVVQALASRTPIISYQWIEDTLKGESEDEIPDLTQYLLSNPRLKYSKLFSGKVFQVLKLRFLKPNGFICMFTTFGKFGSRWKQGQSRDSDHTVWRHCDPRQQSKSCYL